MSRNPIETLKDLEKRLDRRVAGVLNKHVKRMKEKLRADQPLTQRGPRRFPYLSKPARLEGGKLVADLYTPVPWGGVHIGPPGTSVTLHPKAGGVLALPTDFVRRAKGHPVGPKQYAGLIVFAGVMWGKAGWGGAKTGGGLRQRRAAGEKFRKQDLIPLYILKKSIVVRRRIHPQALINWVRPGFLADLYKVMTIGR